MRRALTNILLSILATCLLSTTRAGAQCGCDCDGNGRVGVNDLVRMLVVALGNSDLTCPSFATGHIQINVVVSCVSAALTRVECPPATATPNATPTPIPATATSTSTATRTRTSSAPPTQTPLTFPPADAAAATLATDLLDSIATRVCQTGITPGGRFEVTSTPAGAHLECDSFTGHNGRFDLVKYPSVESARDFFGEPQPEWTVDVAGGGILRELRWVPPCCLHLGGVGSQWEWWKDCWLAGGNTFDDTHYVLTPRGSIVVDALVTSGRLDELSALCGSR